MSTETIPAIMTITEAATVMGMHHTTLRRAIRDGLLPASQPDGRAYRITREQLMRWLETTTKKTKSKKKGS